MRRLRIVYSGHVRSTFHQFVYLQLSYTVPLGNVSREMLWNDEFLAWDQHGGSAICGFAAT